MSDETILTIVARIDERQKALFEDIREIKETFKTHAEDDKGVFQDFKNDYREIKKDVSELRKQLMGISKYAVSLSVVAAGVGSAFVWAWDFFKGLFHGA